MDTELQQRHNELMEENATLKKEKENLWAVIRGMKKNMDLEADERHVLKKKVGELEGEIQLITAPEEATGRVYIAMRERAERTEADLSAFRKHCGGLEKTVDQLHNDTECLMEKLIKEEQENAALKKRGGELQAEYRSLQGSIAEIVRIKDKAETSLAQERKDKNAWLVAYQKKVTNLETDLAALKEAMERHRDIEPTLLSRRFR